MDAPFFECDICTGGTCCRLRPHENNSWLAVIDLENLYDHVTRAKVHRALANIGFSRAAAFKVAGESTIRQGEKYLLPRGFRQSPMLAALVLEQSLFGSYLCKGFYRSTITVFSDDIILSSNDRDELQEEYRHIVSLLRRSNFPINPIKSQSPRREVVVFNMRVSQGGLSFIDERMWKFLKRAVELVLDKPLIYNKLFGNYLSSINSEQAKRLRAWVRAWRSRRASLDLVDR
jgi:reverse transcriptase-like protein